MKGVFAICLLKILLNFCEYRRRDAWSVYIEILLEFIVLFVSKLFTFIITIFSGNGLYLIEFSDL